MTAKLGAALVKEFLKDFEESSKLVHELVLKDDERKEQEEMAKVKHNVAGPRDTYYFKPSWQSLRRRWTGELVVSLEEAEHVIEGLKLTLHTAKNHAEAAERNSKRNLDSAVQLGKSNAALKRDNEALQEALHQANTTIDYLSKKINDDPPTVEELTHAVQEINSGIGTLKRQIDKASEPAKKVQGEINSLNRKLQDMKDRVFPVTGVHKISVLDSHPDKVKFNKKAIAMELGYYLMDKGLIKWTIGCDIIGNTMIRGDVQILLPEYSHLGNNGSGSE